MSLISRLPPMPIPRLARFMAVVAIAMAAGHLAQTLAHRKPDVAVVMGATTLPTHIIQLSSDGTADALPLAADPEPHLLAVESPNPLPNCKAVLTLSARPMAMIDVAVFAPCHQGQRIVLHQAGLAVTGKIGADGRLQAQLPALTADGTISILFGDGAKIEQAVAVPDATALRRFGVQWQGGDAFVLHAMENGADFGQPGDIWRDNRGNATLASGGFLTLLGDKTVDNPLLAEVYTFPTDDMKSRQIVLEAAVLPDTCGHDLLGEVLTSQSGRVQARDLTLAMPDCTGVGDFLVLKNLASDMKIAAN
jgi:hypothetical protein